MTSDPDLDRFRDLSYQEFRRLAADPEISKYNRIGFPDSYRAGFEAAIFRDIRAKLPGLDGGKRVVLDIGPGCSELPIFLTELCREQGNRLIQVDSAEMLAHLPDDEFIRKVEGPFPDCMALLCEDAPNGIDVIVCYSVLHYVFVDADLIEFAIAAASLLNHGGMMLLGDIPNVSKRKRFFSSDAGRQYHREFTGRDEDPVELRTECEEDKINDAVILELLAALRQDGVDAYVLPQPSELPMANRREDILIKRP
jgi:hypothetical protein